MHPRFSLRCFLLLVSLMIRSPLRGDVYEEFEGPETSWRIAEADARPLRTLAHERRFSDAYAGRGCEFIQLSTGQGTNVYLTHAINPSQIIPELIPSVWFKSDRIGQQFLARVVFPRSIGKDGRPITALLAGDSYSEAGSWRQLRIENLPQKLQREARSLRTQKGTTIDEREAYIDQLVLNIYTGRGETSTWLDDLGLSVFASAGSVRPNGTANGPPKNPIETTPVASSVPTSSKPAGLQGNVLVAGERPIFVRAIEHRGETFAFLQSLGFNAVLLTTPATREQLDEAAGTDIWLIAPPPSDAGTLDLQSQHARVLAWFVGEYLTAEHENRVNELVRELQQQDPQRQRPIVFHVSRDFTHFRHDRGILLFERSVVGTSSDMADYGTWLTRAANHGRVDAPFWAAIPTELPAELQKQFEILSENVQSLPAVEPDQLRVPAYEAAARGARGIIFRSRTRLDRQEIATKRRAAMLHALNRELELLDPWAAAGNCLRENATNHPHARVLGLQTTHSRLLIASRLASEQQYVSAANQQLPIAFTIHGIPISDQAYSVNPHGIEPLPVQRGGGVQISLNELQPISVVLLTQDPLAVNYVGRIGSGHRREYAGRQTEVAESLLNETQQVLQQLAGKAKTDPGQSNKLTQARADLRQANSLWESGDARGSIQFSNRCLNGVKAIRRQHWESAVLNFPSPASSPFCASFATLPLHHDLASHLASATWGVDVLAAGEMEYLDHLLQSGWRQDRATISQVNMDVRLSLEKPRAGRSSLELRAWSEEASPPGLDGKWPIVITSAAFPVRAGQLVRIHGWAKVPKQLDGSSEGLMIFDSQTGPALAERISQSQGWREFTLYRVATANGDMRLIFAHTGLGDSWIDDISVQVRNER